MTRMTRTEEPAADPWAAVTAARLPVAGLGSLAAVRNRAGVRVHTDEGTAWVVWQGGSAEVVRCLRPALGVEFFTERGGEWFRFGSRVPTADRPPGGPGRSPDAALVPARVEPAPVRPGSLEPVRIGVVRGGTVQPATALRCRASDLLPWADTATTAELRAVRAARRNQDAILRGDRLPSIRGATRYWGTTLLVPLGSRPDPDLPPSVIRAACGVGSDALLVLDESGAVVVPEAAFTPLTRAGIRLAAEPR